MRERQVDLGYLMTPGLSKDIQCYVSPYTVLNSMVQREQRDHYEGGRGRAG